MIKVLMIGNHKSNKGGMTSVITQILDYNWKKESINLEFIPTYINSNNICKALFFAWSYLRIVFCFIFNKPDVVHMHMSYKGSFSRKFYIHNLCKFFGVKYIIHLHGSEFKKWYDTCDESKQQKIKTLFNESLCTFVLGENWKNILREICPSANITILRNAIKIPTECVSINEKFKFLYLGVLIKRKGLIDLIDAINQLNKQNRFVNKELIIAGVGEEESYLRKCKSIN